MDIDIYSLHKVHEVRERNKRLVYETIYQKCRNKILHANNNLYQKTLWFDIPTIVFGLPLYNMDACICYMIYRLRDQGFTVEYYAPNSLYISWHEKPSDYKPFPLVPQKSINKNHDNTKQVKNGPIVLKGLGKLRKTAEYLRKKQL